MTETLSIEHKVTNTQDAAGQHQRSCTCGWKSATWAGRPAKPGPCPNDRTVVALVTLQFAWGGLFDAKPAGPHIHLVTAVAAGGTPGPTLCGIDRFAKDAPGWSVGGGVTGPGISLAPCPGCADVAREQYPGLPVSGSVGGKEMAAELGVPHGR